MKLYLYDCPKCGEYESAQRGDKGTCPKCGRITKRLYVAAVNYHPTKGK